MAVLAAFALAAFTPVTTALARRMPPETSAHADAIVVLGSGVMPEGELDDTSLRRTVHGVRLFRRGLAPHLVLLGPARDGVVEAEVRARYAADLGVPEDALVVERGGQSTREEAALVARRLQPASILLVTGLHHLPRARAVFERAGIRVHAAPVLEQSALSERPQARLALVRAVVQEWIARGYYRLSGGL